MLREPFKIGLFLFQFGLLLFPSSLNADSPAIPLSQAAAERLSVPPGFQISVYADDLGSRPGNGAIARGEPLRLRYGRGKDFEADRLRARRSRESQVVIEGLNSPHSLAFFQGYVYVGETNRVSRFSLSDHRLSADDGKTIVDLPSGGGHHTRTVLFGPDGKLYVSIGSSCNACEEEDPRRAAIYRCNPDGSEFEVYARGLRNAVGMIFKPGTGELFASCNGRDLLGDDLPP